MQYNDFDTWIGRDLISLLIIIYVDKNFENRSPNREPLSVTCISFFFFWKTEQQKQTSRHLPRTKNPPVTFCLHSQLGHARVECKMARNNTANFRKRVSQRQNAKNPTKKSHLGNYAWKKQWPTHFGNFWFFNIWWRLLKKVVNLSVTTGFEGLDSYRTTALWKYVMMVFSHGDCVMCVCMWMNEEREETRERESCFVIDP